MTTSGWIALALLVAYWYWMMTKSVKTVSYIVPSLVTLVLGYLVYSSATAVPTMTMGGRRY